VKCGYIFIVRQQFKGIKMSTKNIDKQEVIVHTDIRGMKTVYCDSIEQVNACKVDLLLKGNIKNISELLDTNVSYSFRVFTIDGSETIALYIYYK
jgi:hypothetical protein